MVFSHTSSILFRNTRSCYHVFISLVALTLILFLCISNVYSAQATLSWNPNSESDLAGYKVYYGNSSGSYSSSIDAGNQTSYTISNLVEGEIYFFAATAYDFSGNESGYSNEVSYDVPVDTDADGYNSDVDCDDTNAAINPGATETLYNGIDDDCNPATPDTVDADAEVAIVGSWTSGLSHAVESGTNRVLLFTAHVENNGTISLDSVTYGGQPMTRIIDFEQGSNHRAYTAAFILDEAGIAAATNSSFSPSWSSSTTRTPGYSSVFLTGVDQANMINDWDGSGANSQDSVSTAPLITAAGDLVIVAGTSGNSGSYAVNNGFTEAIEIAISSSDGVVGYKSATGSNETPSVTQSGANRQAVIGFVVSNGNGIQLCSPDSYEPDDSSGQANTISSGVPQTHNICLSWDMEYV